jgi:hypothetical protein
MSSFNKTITNDLGKGGVALEEKEEWEQESLGKRKPKEDASIAAGVKKIKKCYPKLMEKGEVQQHLVYLRSRLVLLKEVYEQKRDHDDFLAKAITKIINTRQALTSGLVRKAEESITKLEGLTEGLPNKVATQLRFI